VVKQARNVIAAELTSWRTTRIRQDEESEICGKAVIDSGALEIS